MNFKEVEKVAREKFNGSCKVCKVCNGIACAGEVPGMGGKGSGSSFIDNRKSLEKIKINMRVIHNVSNPDITIELFGMKMGQVHSSLFTQVTGGLYMMIKAKLFKNQRGLFKIIGSHPK
mgnify:CR=1 FL=1